LADAASLVHVTEQTLTTIGRPWKGSCRVGSGFLVRADLLRSQGHPQGHPQVDAREPRTLSSRDARDDG
jgi:hypothetical protein